jgi:hypothetical protein
MECSFSDFVAAHPYYGLLVALGSWQLGWWIGCFLRDSIER